METAASSRKIGAEVEAHGSPDHGDSGRGEEGLPIRDLVETALYRVKQ